MDELAAFSTELTRLADSLQGEGLTKVMDGIGVAAKAIGNEHLQRALGPDQKFSGFQRAGKIAIRYDHKEPGRIELGPGKNAGPAILQELGRRTGKHGTTSGFHAIQAGYAELDGQLDRIIETELIKVIKGIVT